MKLQKIKIISMLIILITSFIIIISINNINKTCDMGNLESVEEEDEYYMSDEYFMGDDKLTKVIDGLYIGDINDASNLQKLKNENIKYIVNVTADIPIYFQKEFNYLRIPIDDHCSANISQYIQPAVDYIDLNIQKGNVFVHCYAGISRSASIIIAYLILKKNYTYSDAYNLLKSKRPIIHPNSGFNKILQNL